MSIRMWPAANRPMARTPTQGTKLTAAIILVNVQIDAAAVSSTALTAAGQRRLIEPAHNQIVRITMAVIDRINAMVFKAVANAIEINMFLLLKVRAEVASTI